MSSPRISLPNVTVKEGDYFCLMRSQTFATTIIRSRRMTPTPISSAKWKQAPENDNKRLGNTMYVQGPVAGLGTTQGHKVINSP